MRSLNRWEILALLGVPLATPFVGWLLGGTEGLATGALAILPVCLAMAGGLLLGRGAIRVARWLGSGGLRGLLRLTRWGFWSGASAAILVLVALAWTRSHWRADAFFLHLRSGSCLWVAGCQGVLSIELDRGPGPASNRRISHESWAVEDYLRLLVGLALTRASAAGQGSVSADSYSVRSFRCDERTWSMPDGVLSATRVAFPYWLILIALAVLPLRRMLGGVRRYRRGLRGLCVECGYDLRGVDKRCPECGAVIAAPSISAGRQAGV
jgi:hypothetical protein